MGGGFAVRVMVHKRVHERHPELTEEDVLTAYRNSLRYAQRSDKDDSEYAGIGTDGRGRLVEYVAVVMPEGELLIYHAQTPPGKAMLEELGFVKR